MTIYIFFRIFTYFCVATLAYRRGWYGSTCLLVSLALGALTPEVFSFPYYQDVVLILIVLSTLFIGFQAYKKREM